MAEYQEAIKEIVSQVRQANVGAIFGEPQQFGSQSVIPVGQISYGWGGGSGKGKNEEDEQGEGSGVGMGVKVKPIGYIDIKETGATFRPILNFTPIIAHSDQFGHSFR